MDTHVENLLDAFKENENTLNFMKDFVVDYLKKIICVENKIFVAGIEARVKTYDSLKNKLILKGHKYKTIFDITDLLGARVITFYSDHVDIIASLIEKNFKIDYENSVDKRKMYEVDRFGYMSLHYICQIPKEIYYDENNKIINEIKFEIQMRTTLQHVWATIFHDTGYKSDVEVPKEYIRKLARLEGLLEVADDEFLSIRSDIDEYRKKIRSLVSKGEFKDISFNIDSYKNYLALNPYDQLINKIASINNAEVEKISYLRFYEALVSLNIKTLIEIEQMRIDNSEDAYKLALSQFSGTDIDIISSTVAMQNILIFYILKKGGSKNDIKNVLEMANGRVSDKYLDNIIVKSKGILL